jgi:hypothetical protein
MGSRLGAVESGFFCSHSLVQNGDYIHFTPTIEQLSF